MHPRTAPLPFGLLAVIGLINAAAAAYLLTGTTQDAALAGVMLVASLTALGAAWALTASVATPLTQLAQSLGAVARGDRMVAIPGLGRADEIGAMAAAVALIRDRPALPPALTGNPATDLAVMAEDIARAVDGATGAVRVVEGSIVTVTRELHGGAEAAEAMARAARDAHESVVELRQLLGRITAAPEAEADRRASIRVPLRRGAMLELAGRRAVAVNLLDLSEGGAALDATGAEAEVGMEGALVFGTSLIPMRVVALGQDRLHVAFTALSPEARLAIRHIMNGAEAALAA
jgi:HAMP domain-containing protein